MSVQNKQELPNLKNLFRLDGRIALVTGATGHLGKSITRGLCAAGSQVILNGRSKEKVETFAQELKAEGFNASMAAFDITDPSKLKEFFDNIKLHNSKLDIIVNNAYAGKSGTIESSTMEDFYSSFDLNVTAIFKIIQLARPLLEKAGKENPGGASIINIASMYGLVSPDPSIYGDSGENNPPYYGVAKAATIQLTRYLACHLAHNKIRVNAISPGAFPLPEIKNKNPQFHSKLCNKNPMQRIGLADELCGPVVFLASDASSYITGSNLIVDGGWTAW